MSDTLKAAATIASTVLSVTKSEPLIKGDNV